eukprot:COSAG01_NODE_3170_length_6472_cov_2.238820_5_plen_441_part_00
MQRSSSRAQQAAASRLQGGESARRRSHAVACCDPGGRSRSLRGRPGPRPYTYSVADAAASSQYRGDDSTMATLLCATALLVTTTTKATPAAAERQLPPPSPHCLGEYVEDSGSGECVLAANGGDWDEPSATHRSCSAHQYLCPDRSTCVDTAAEYARCATGKGEGSSLLHAAAVAAGGPGRAVPGSAAPVDTTAPPCDLNGTWACDLGAGITCEVVESSNGASFTVTPSSSAAWLSGHATIVGSSVNILYQVSPSFHGPHARHGLLRCGSGEHAAASITWNDTSSWQQQRSSIEPLDVHIIAHTHDDTGYLSTVDEYYESNVRSILTTVTQELQKNPERKFTYVEIAFFAKWWEEQTNVTKDVFRQLVAAGQLDFSNGGWCMPDEGAPSYQDMLANMQTGLRYIQREFGQDARPRVAWSIDPFGHSSTYGTLNAMFQFDM